MLKYSKITVWIELRVAEEEFWLIYSLDFASLVEWLESCVGRDVGTRKDLGKGKIVLEFALKKSKCSVIDWKINRWWQFLFHHLTIVWQYNRSMVFCFYNCSDLSTVRKNCSRDWEKKICKIFEITRTIYSNRERQEQFFKQWAF